MTYPAPGQVDVPGHGLGPSAVPARLRPRTGGGARNRIAAVLSPALPYVGSPGRGDPDAAARRGDDPHEGRRRGAGADPERLPEGRPVRRRRR